MGKQFSVKDEKPWRSCFFTIWGGQAFSILGSQLVQFALIWHLTSVFPLAVGGALLVGFMMPITNGPFYAVIQSTVQPDMQARIFSLLGSVGSAMAPLYVLMGVAAYLTPVVMNIEESHDIIDDFQINVVSLTVK